MTTQSQFLNSTALAAIEKRLLEARQSVPRWDSPSVGLNTVEFGGGLRLGIDVMTEKVLKFKDGQWMQVPQFDGLARLFEAAFESSVLMRDVDLLLAEVRALHEGPDSTAPWVLVGDWLPERNLPLLNEEDEDDEVSYSSEEVLIRYEHPMTERLPHASKVLGYLVALANLYDDGCWYDSETGRKYEKVAAWMPLPPFEGACSS